MIFENAEGVATGNAPVLTGIAAKDHAGITLEGQGKKLSHFLNTHRSCFIENNHASRVQCVLQLWIDKQAPESRRIKALISEHLGGGGGGGAAEHALAPGFLDAAGDFGKGGAFSRAGQSPNAGEAVAALENEFDRASLILAKTVRRNKMAVDREERILALIHRADQSQFALQNFPRGNFPAHPNEFRLGFEPFL